MVFSLFDQFLNAFNTGFSTLITTIFGGGS